MIKKIISFICCLTPIGAMAANQLTPDASGNVNVADDLSVGTTTVVGNDGGTVAQSLGVGGNLTVAKDILVGDSYSGTDTDANLYVLPETSQDFTMFVGGTVDVTGALNIVDGRNFTLRTKTGTDKITTATFGSVTNVNGTDGAATGTLTMADIGALTINGALTSAGLVDISADSMTAGAVALNAAAGENVFNITGAMNMGGLVAKNGATTTITAGSITSNGTIQQNAGGDMAINVGGALTVNNGDIDNKGTKFTITGTGDAADITVSSGTIQNNVGGTMTLTGIRDLTINGGDADTGSIINAGVFTANVSGKTTLANGLVLGGTSFELATGSLDLGANKDILNNLSSTSITVNDAAATTAFGKIANGIAGGTLNQSASMNLNVAGTMTAAAVENNATDLTINGGTITVDSVNGAAAASQTKIIASSALTVTGNVSNSGTTTLNGASVTIGGATNSGGVLNITSTTDDGNVEINGNLTNSGGTTNVNAAGVTVDGILENSAGTTKLVGATNVGNSGGLTISGVNVTGGTVDVNAWVGQIDITNDLLVRGGALNIGNAVTRMNVHGNADIVGGLRLGTGGDGVNVNKSGAFALVSDNAAGKITIHGDAVATGAGGHSATLDAVTVTVDGDVTANGGNLLRFGDTYATNVQITGDVSADNGGTVEFMAPVTGADSITDNTSGKIVARAAQFTSETDATSAVITAAGTKGIDINNGIWFGANTSGQAKGMVIVNAAGVSNGSATLAAIAADIDVADGVTIGGGNRLMINGGRNVTLGGNITADGILNVSATGGAATIATGDSDTITVNKQLSVDAYTIAMGDITNNAGGAVDLKSTGGNISAGIIANSGALNISGAGLTTLASLDNNNAGTADIRTQNLKITSDMTITGGAVSMDASYIDVGGDVLVYGDIVQSATGGMLNLKSSDLTFVADNFQTQNNGGFTAATGSVGEYDITGAVDIAGAWDVAAGADISFDAKTVVGGDLHNAGNLRIDVTDGIEMGAIDAVGGTLTMNAGNNGVISAAALTNTGAAVSMHGAQLNLNNNAAAALGQFNATGLLTQNAGSIGAGDVNVVADKFAITASNITVGGIAQNTGTMRLNTSDITVGGATQQNGIDARDLTIAANPGQWLTADVFGNISGGVKFVGLEHMLVHGNYIFDDASTLNAAILAPGTDAAGELVHNYWATVSLNQDNTLGQITNAPGADALIGVDGKFIADISQPALGNLGTDTDQVSITLNSIVDQGRAIWLVHADDGLVELDGKIRNLSVMFCNASGTICVDYLALGNANNGSDSELPAFLSVRDTDNDGTSDSIYVVFDPRFGGPVEIFGIQPIVGRVPNSTRGEYTSAGALDALIASRLGQTGFYGRTPIELIPVIFQNTNMATAAQQLYDRMEYYNANRDGASLARFSRLFQPRELEQIAGSVILNEHTYFRGFEDRMFDEFIWNRNRNLKKAWADVDFGMFAQDISDGKRADGTRFSISGGFDWQHNNTLILGLTGRVSHTTGSDTDAIDLGYKPGEHVLSHVDTDVSDTSIGVGAYLMKTLGTGARVYGNAFVDAHIFDISRTQAYVPDISGDGTAFSLISEWGLVHDLLNQYIVGNVYARVGYNTGFSVTENAGGSDYMKMESDGYMILTPGYSLTAQKRIYPSAWFQVRPYASIGVEYDVLGAPDSVRYQFAMANGFTDYDIEIDPLWANIGGGVEMLSAHGFQFGIDYRYQYNADMQLHNIKVSGSYRF